MIIIVVFSAITGLHRLLSLRFQVSLHYSFYGTLFRATVNFHVDGRGLVYSYVLITFSSCILPPLVFPPFLRHAFIFCLHLVLFSWRSQSGGVGGFWVGAVACIVLLVLDGPAIALRDRPLSPRYHGPVVDLMFYRYTAFGFYFLMYMCAKNVLLTSFQPFSRGLFIRRHAFRVYFERSCLPIRRSL